jgi:hypothetical protein
MQISECDPAARAIGSRLILSLLLIGLIPLGATAEPPPITITCRLISPVESDGYVSAEPVLEVSNVTANWLRNVLIRLDGESEATITGELRRAVHLAPTPVYVITGDFTAPATFLSEETELDWEWSFEGADEVLMPLKSSNCSV